MQLLVAHDVQFAGAWRRLDNETKLFVVSLALGNKVSRHGHTLHVLNIPFAVILLENIKLILFHVATIILVFIQSTILLFDYIFSWLFLPKKVLGNIKLKLELSFKIVGRFSKGKSPLGDMDMRPIVVSHIIHFLQYVVMRKVYYLFHDKFIVEVVSQQVDLLLIVHHE